MVWETLPRWFWIIYFLFLLITLGVAVYSLLKRKLFVMSSFTIMFVITIPVISFINSIERHDGLNELDYFIEQLQQGETWTIYSSIGYIYLLIWWGLFIIKKRTTYSELEP